MAIAAYHYRNRIRIIIGVLAAVYHNRIIDRILCRFLFSVYQRHRFG